MGLTKPRATQIYDIDYKQATRVITLTNITLSGGAPSTVDGVGLSVGDRVLVTGQSTASQNGIYYVTTLGSGSNGTWARTSDTNETGELDAGTIVMVTEGTIYHDTQWKLTTNNPIVIGTTALTFEQNSAFAFGNVYANSTAVLATTVGDVLTLTAGNNISITGNASAKSVKVDVTQVISVTGNVTGGNINTSGIVSATGNINGGNVNGGANVNATLHSGTTVSVSGNITGANIIGTTNITSQGQLGGNNQLVMNSYAGAGEGAQMVLAWKGVSNLTGQGNGSWNIDIDSANTYRTFYQNAAGATSVMLSFDPSTNVAVFPSTAGLSATGNVTGANLVTAGNITAVGNIHCDPGHYFIGNGSQLTGISGGGGGGSSISNGGSNIGVAFNANATVGIAGILTATFSPDYLVLTGTNTPGFYAQLKNAAVSSSLTLPTSRSIMSIAPFVINTGAVVTVPDSTTLIVLT